MTTAQQVFPHQIPRPATTASPRRPGQLPDPGERRRLREQWGLSTRQVAQAFGVTPATVRSWERGRSTPRGGRKEAYRRFLAGLAQHGAAGAGTPDGSASRVRRPKDRPPLRARTRPAAPTTDGTSRRPQGPAGPASPWVRPVGRGGPDPVAPARIRRLRLLGAAACVWSLAWWVVLTCPPPL
ncbi:helix-turn-helix domain-containing protein [Streptomyces sp. NPDC014861]|uniref:helix-turn-helix domain-containing protein n=1 Tax=Streptomyces sp. NPDC014861 TaxID=3364923 RepID=UPI0036F5B946